MTNEFSLVEYENEFLKNKPNLSKYRPGLYPSEASVEYVSNGTKVVKGKCIREAWYRIKGFNKTRPFSSTLQMKAEVGKLVEESTVDRIKRMGLYVQNSIKFFNQKYVLSGELDLIYRNPVSGNLVGQEEKSYYGMYAEKEILGYKGTIGNSKTPAKPAINGRPKDQHILQSLLYAWDYREELPEYRIYYHNRGDGKRCEFQIGFQEEGNLARCWYKQIRGPYWVSYSPEKVILPYTIQDIHARLQKLIDYVKSNELPPRDYEETLRDDQVEKLRTLGLIRKGEYDKWAKNPQKYPIKPWICSYCSYAEHCKKNLTKPE
jgi:CRISPR/Cas system-associated exonuclease Cas4 (RecB family)